MSAIELSVPGDKSIAHRAVLLGMLADGDSLVHNVPSSGDVESSIAAARAFGVDVERDGATLRIHGRGARALRSPKTAIDCANSGTTARLCMGIAAPLDGETILDGDASLRARPMERVAEPLRRAGGRIESLHRNGRLPVIVRGAALGPIWHETDVASAQLKSALLLAGIVAWMPAVVRAPPSRDHTERMLRAMGLAVDEVVEEGMARVGISPPLGPLRPLDLAIPGDASSAAFLVAASLVSGKPIVIRDVGVNPGRTGFLDIARRMGARIEEREQAPRGGEPVADLIVTPGPLVATEVSGGEVARAIDELPLVAVLAAHASGSTTVRDAAELRAKESDRIAALCANLQSLRVEVEERPDGFAVQGSGRALSGRARSFGDHRIAMAFAVLGLRPGSRVDIDDLDVAGVSFPGFPAQIARLATDMTTLGGIR